MTRPCFALSVLLGSLAASMLVVGSANCQSMCAEAKYRLARERFDCAYDEYGGCYDYSYYDYSDYDYNDYDYGDAPVEGSDPQSEVIADESHMRGADVVASAQADALVPDHEEAGSLAERDAYDCYDYDCYDYYDCYESDTAWDQRGDELDDTQATAAVAGAADPPAAASPLDVASYLTGYDPVYDAAVYGAVRGESVASADPAEAFDEDASLESYWDLCDAADMCADEYSAEYEVSHAADPSEPYGSGCEGSEVCWGEGCEPQTDERHAAAQVPFAARVGDAGDLWQEFGLFGLAGRLLEKAANEAPGSAALASEREADATAAVTPLPTAPVDELRGAGAAGQALELIETAEALEGLGAALTEAARHLRELAELQRTSMDRRVSAAR